MVHDSRMGAALFARTSLAFVATAVVACSSVVVLPDSAVDASSMSDATVSPDAPHESGSAPDGADATTVPLDGGRLDDLIISGNLPAFDGIVIHLALEDRVHGVITRTDMFTASATGGLMVFWPAAFDRDAFGMMLHVYADMNRDGVCSSRDPTWDAFINNDFMIGHAMVFNLTFPDAGATPGACAAFP